MDIPHYFLRFLGDSEMKTITKLFNVEKRIALNYVKCGVFFLFYNNQSLTLPQLILAIPSILFTHNQSEWIQNIAMNVPDKLL